MENSKFTPSRCKARQPGVLEMCLPCYSSNLAEELSVLSVAPASCYSYPSGVAEMSELAPGPNIRAHGPHELCKDVCVSTLKSFI
jgi:hypothetical protein